MTLSPDRTDPRASTPLATISLPAPVDVFLSPTDEADIASQLPIISDTDTQAASVLTDTAPQHVAASHQTPAAAAEQGEVVVNVVDGVPSNDAVTIGVGGSGQEGEAPVYVTPPHETSASDDTVTFRPVYSWFNPNALEDAEDQIRNNVEDQANIEQENTGTCDNIEAPTEKEKKREEKKKRRNKKKEKEDEIKQNKFDKKRRYQEAVKAMKSGEYKSYHSCAKAFGVVDTQLKKYVLNGTSYVGKGCVSKIFTPEEEKQLKEHVIEQASYGFGYSYDDLRLCMQELLSEVCRSNPDRKASIPEDWDNFMPPKHFPYNFCMRNRLVLHRTMYLSEGRAKITVAKYQAWKAKLETILSRPDIAEIMKDPRRVFNNDETPLCAGVSNSVTLCEKGKRGPSYNRAGDTRLQITASLTISADGRLAQLEIVHRGERILCGVDSEGKPRKYLSDLGRDETDGIIPEIGFQVSEFGKVRRKQFLELLKRLLKWLIANNIPRPVILWVDGYGGHKGWSISKFCRENGIFLLLLLENGTHLTQPLDRTVFSSLKCAMKKCLNAWSLANSGKTLDKYTLVKAVYPAFRMALGDGKVIREGFRATDIWPWGQGNVDLERLRPSEVFASEEDELSQPPAVAVHDPIEVEADDVINLDNVLDQHSPENPSVADDYTAMETGQDSLASDVLMCEGEGGAFQSQPEQAIFSAASSSMTESVATTVATSSVPSASTSSPPVLPGTSTSGASGLPLVAGSATTGANQDMSLDERRRK